MSYMKDKEKIQIRAVTEQDMLTIYEQICALEEKEFKRTNFTKKRALLNLI